MIEVTILPTKGFLQPGQAFAEEQTKRSTREGYIPHLLRFDLHDFANDLLFHCVAARNRSYHGHDATLFVKSDFDTRVLLLQLFNERKTRRASKEVVPDGLFVEHDGVPTE